MDLSTVFEVFLDLLLIYLVFGLTVSTIIEILAMLYEWRANHLIESISNAFDNNPYSNKGTKLAKAMFAHPIIKSINQQSRWRARICSSIGPSYLPSDLFVDALIDTLIKKYQLDITNYSRFINLLANQRIHCLPDNLLSVLRLLSKRANYEYDDYKNGIRSLIAKWYMASMDRASGVYRRNINGISLLLSLAIVLILNLDSVCMSNRIITNRAILNTRVEFINNLANNSAKCLVNASNELDRQNCMELLQIDVPVVLERTQVFPFGWSSSANIITCGDLPSKILGWGVSTVLISAVSQLVS